MRTIEHNKKIGKAQKVAWDDGRRKRVPIGTERIKNGIIQIKSLSPKGWPFWKVKNKKNYDKMSKKELMKLSRSMKCILRKKGFNIPKLSSGQKKGYKQTSEHIEKRRQSLRKYLFDMRSLDKETKERIRKSLEYQRWRLAVFVRDSWTCQKCGARSGNEKTVYIEAHHKKSFTKYVKLRFDVDNGLTLCKKCHKIKSFEQMNGNKNAMVPKKHQNVLL